MSGTQDNPDTDQLVQAIDRIKTYVKMRRTSGSPNEYNFHPTNTGDTQRTHVRLTDDLKSWAEGQTVDSLFSSREMVLGMAVAFAANHEARFHKFSLEEAYSADIREMGLDGEGMSPNLPSSEQTMSSNDENAENVPSNGDSTTQDVPTDEDSGTNDVSSDEPLDPELDRQFEEEFREEDFGE